MSRVFSTDSGFRERIISAFGGHYDVWRTPGGIARHVGFPVETVKTYLDANADLFRRSPIEPGGIRLYALRSPRSPSSFSELTGLKG